MALTSSIAMLEVVVTCLVGYLLYLQEEGHDPLHHRHHTCLPEGIVQGSFRVLFESPQGEYGIFPSVLPKSQPHSGIVQGK